MCIYSGTLVSQTLIIANTVSSSLAIHYIVEVLPTYKHRLLTNLNYQCA